jgi:hypothetical protein
MGRPRRHPQAVDELPCLEPKQGPVFPRKVLHPKNDAAMLESRVTALTKSSRTHRGEPMFQGATPK